MKTALPFDFPLPLFVGVGTLFPPPDREGKARLNKIKNTF